MRVALVHDHLCQDGGAEKVLQVFCKMFPSAPIFTLTYEDWNIKKNYPGRHIEASIIHRMPGGIKHYRWFMPFMPMATEFFDLSGYDVVLSSSSSFAKGVITTPDTLHVCYCHTPTRYLWSDTHSYINDLPYNKYFKKVISLAMNYTRMWDKLAADRVDEYISNSQTSLRRIKKYYKREAEIIHPSIRLQDFYVSEKPEDFYLAGCRLVPYKRVDIVIKAFKELGKPLKIFGDGLDLERLREIADGAENIEFLGRVSEKEKFELYSKCQAFINPQLEDFGITPLEAMASGRPVIAFGKGGSLESIVEGKTGIFFPSEKPEAIIEAVKRFESMEFDPEEIRKHAEKFSEEKFIEQIDNFIKEKYEKFEAR